jgi:UDP-sugar transporter A1/2/3
MATGVSIVVATAFSTILFGTPLNNQFVVGATLILLSVYFFSNPLPMGIGSPDKMATEMKNLLPK